MAGMTVEIEIPEGQDALTEFILFRDRVYENRRARWPALIDLELPSLMGEGALQAASWPASARSISATVSGTP